jgi:TRAP-type C4-dicarboxylate transport system permease small subunit
MDRVLRVVDRVVAAAIGVIALVLLLTAFGQVIARYVLARPFSWVLELDVLLLVWLTMLSGYLGVRRRAHMAIDLVTIRLAPRARRAVATASLLLSAAFIAVLGWTSFAVIDAMEGIAFVALPLGQAALYWSLPVAAALMLVAFADEMHRALMR